MAPNPPPDLRRAPLRRLRYEAGAVKAYLAGPPPRRRLMRRERLLWLLNRRVTPLLAIENDGIRYLVETSDRGPITLRLFAWGHHEEPLMRRVAALVEAELGRPALRGRTFVDVGANIGTATLCALLRFGAARAVALEPHAGNHRGLRLNLVANGVEDRVTVLQAAVSDAPGELELELATHNIGDHRIRTGAEDGPGALGESSRRGEAVPAVVLDDALADQGVAAEDIGLVWIDVQGHEPQVLSGMSRLLAAGVPVLIEYWPYGLRRAGGLERLDALLREGDFAVWDVGEETDKAPPQRLAPDQLAALPQRLPGEDDATNLLLLSA